MVDGFDRSQIIGIRIPIGLLDHIKNGFQHPEILLNVHHLVGRRDVIGRSIEVDPCEAGGSLKPLRLIGRIPSYDFWAAVIGERGVATHGARAAAAHGVCRVAATRATKHVPAAGSASHRATAHSSHGASAHSSHGSSAHISHRRRTPFRTDLFGELRKASFDVSTVSHSILFSRFVLLLHLIELGKFLLDGKITTKCGANLFGEVGWEDEKFLLLLVLVAPCGPGRNFRLVSDVIHLVKYGLVRESIL